MLAQQDEDRTEQRRKARTDKKAAQKNLQKGAGAGEKRKAEDRWSHNSGRWRWRPQTKESVDIVLLYYMVSPPVMSAASKRQRGDGDQPTEEHMETETGVFGRSAPAKSGQQGAAAPSQRGSSEDKAEQRNDECSVFISNLAYTLPEPEDQLRRLFEACGPLQNIRPVFSNKGSFKGYCYVQFESAASIPAALRLDRTQVEGRPMFVSPCVDKNRNPNFKVDISFLFFLCPF